MAQQPRLALTDTELTELEAIRAELRDVDARRRSIGDRLHAVALGADRRAFAGQALSESAADPLTSLLNAFIRSFPVRRFESDNTPAKTAPLR